VAAPPGWVRVARGLIRRCRSPVVISDVASARQDPGHLRTARRTAQSRPSRSARFGDCMLRRRCGIPYPDPGAARIHTTGSACLAGGPAPPHALCHHRVQLSPTDWNSRPGRDSDRTDPGRHPSGTSTPQRLTPALDRDQLPTTITQTVPQVDPAVGHKRGAGGTIQELFRWSRRVSTVQVGQPQPRKSWSPVRMAASRARASATGGQSRGSRGTRRRAVASWCA